VPANKVNGPLFSFIAAADTNLPETSRDSPDSRGWRRRRSRDCDRRRDDYGGSIRRDDERYRLWSNPDD
jgi:hypothetical protein